MNISLGVNGKPVWLVCLLMFARQGEPRSILLEVSLRPDGGLGMTRSLKSSESHGRALAARSSSFPLGLTTTTVSWVFYCLGQILDAAFLKVKKKVNNTQLFKKVVLRAARDFLNTHS